MVNYQGEIRASEPATDYPRSSFTNRLLGVRPQCCPLRGRAAGRFGVGAGFGVMIKNDPLILGKRSVWGGEVPFGIHPMDARHHCYIIGKTGSGKTTLLRNLIIQHIHRGHGVAVILKG